MEGKQKQGISLEKEKGTLFIGGSKQVSLPDRTIEL